MHILFLYKAYGNTAHDFRQYFFNEFEKHCKVTYFNCSLRENNKLGTFEAILAKACPNDPPDVVFIFTIAKVGHPKGMENFKGLIVLYECDSESYRGKIVDYLNTYKNIRLATFEFYPDCEWEGYPVEHRLWLPPAVTSEDKDRKLERIYDFGHCGSYATYRAWHMSRIRFVTNVLPNIPWLKMEIRGERLDTIGRSSLPICSSKELSIFANQTKIMFACPTKWKWLTHQYFYPSANGCLIVGTRPRGFEYQMIPESLVELKDDYADAEEKIKYYLEHENERSALIEKAQKHIQEKHTVEARVKTLLTKIKEIA